MYKRQVGVWERGFELGLREPKAAGWDVQMMMTMPFSDNPFLYRLSVFRPNERTSLKNMAHTTTHWWHDQCNMLPATAMLPSYQTAVTNAMPPICCPPLQCYQATNLPTAATTAMLPSYADSGPFARRPPHPVSGRERTQASTTARLIPSHLPHPARRQLLG